MKNNRIEKYILTLIVFFLISCDSNRIYEKNISIKNSVWELSEKLGLKAFKKEAKHSIFDDHVPLYEIAGIPAIDIIDFDFPNEMVNYHHTHNDIVQNCSPDGLYQVGTLLVNHIYGKKNE